MHVDCVPHVATYVLNFTTTNIFFSANRHLETAYFSLHLCHYFVKQSLSSVTSNNIY